MWGAPGARGASFVSGLRCVECGALTADAPDATLCAACCGNLDVNYDYERVRAAFARRADNPQTESPARRDRVAPPVPPAGTDGIWRWLPLLPLRARPRIPLPVGDTPLVEAERLARELGVASLHIKDEGRNPSASLKDRASAVAIGRALEARAPRMTCASTGNAASSLATIAASVGLETVIFVPRTIPRPKLAQLLLHGARVLVVDGDYDTAFDLSLEATRRFGWLSRNSGFNPFLSEGKKTVALEILETLAWNPPDRIFVSVGDGCILGGVHKAISDCLALGWIDIAPRLYGVQAEGAAPLVRAFRSGEQRVSATAAPATFADSIAVGRPRDAAKALRAVRETGGEMLAVADDEIREAMRRLARDAGVFAEPAGAAGFAGFLRLVSEGRVAHDERIAVIVTGSGLKDVESALSLVAAPEPIAANLDAAARALGI
ncbi:MAG: threonine synthase [bacterium]